MLKLAREAGLGRPLQEELDAGWANSRYGFAHLLALDVSTAAQEVSSDAVRSVTPHVLRHSTAMTILHATGDIRKVSLWLARAVTKTTELYLRASPAEELEILEAYTPPPIRPGKFRMRTTA